MANRVYLLLIYCFTTELIVVCFELKVALWMIAYRAYFGCFFADDDVSAVAALPYTVVLA